MKFSFSNHFLRLSVMKYFLFACILSLASLVLCEEIPDKAESGLGSLIWLPGSHYNSFWFVPSFNKFLGTIITAAALPVIWLTLMIVAIAGMILVRLVEPKKKTALEEMQNEIRFDEAE